MSSRFPSSALAVAALAALAACDNGAKAGDTTHRQSTSQFAQNTQQQTVEPPTQGGPGPQYANDSKQVAEGKKLFTEYNCVGCHFNGAGGIGPAFLDKVWTYGGSIEQIHASIRDGRPNGMPAWGGKLSDEQIWQLAAYAHSLPSDAPIPTRPPAATVASPDSLQPHPLKVIKAEP
jgi:cytochrome c oxidase cbb3-type subunit 3